MKDKFFAQECLDKLKYGADPLALMTEAQNSAVNVGHQFFASMGSADAVNGTLEEMEELKEAILEDHSQEAVRNEIGDVLFGLINICRLKGISFDEMVDKMAERWLERKAYQEKRIEEQGLDWRTVSPELSSEFWKEAKATLKNKEYL